MLTKTKITLAATLFAATSSVAMAQGFDPNMANRYPHMANPQTYGYVEGSNAPAKMQPAQQSAQVRLHQGRNNGTFRSAPVQLDQGRDAGFTSEQPSSSYWGPTEIDVDRADRASSPYAGGGY